MFYLICLAIISVLFSSIIPIIGTDVWYPQFVALFLLGVFVYAKHMFDWNKVVGCFIAYLGISVVFISRQEPSAIICLVQICFCSLIIKTISELTREQSKIIWKILLFLFFAQLFWGCLQKFGLDPIFHLKNNPTVDDTVGFSGSHNQYGLSVASLAPSLLILGFGFFPISIIGVILSQTLTAMLGLSAACSLICWYKFRFDWKSNIIVFLIGLIIFFGVLKKPVAEKFNERFGLWKLSVSQVITGKAIMEINENTKVIRTCNPLFGYGFESFMKISPYTQRKIISLTGFGKQYGVEERHSHRYEHAHNDAVEVLFDLGIVGIGFLTWFLVDLVLKYKSVVVTQLLIMPAASILSYAVCSLGIYTVHTAASGFYLSVFLGLFYAEVRNGKKRTNGQAS